MMRLKGLLALAAFFGLVQGAVAQPHDEGEPHDQCERYLVDGAEPGVQVTYSPRDANHHNALNDAINEIFGANGICAQLGLYQPPHQLIFAPSDELGVLASLGRHAIPNWIDGATILGSLKGVGGVLEFVTPGCPTCRSYYSDNTGLEAQISVLMHVAGHNNFSLNSPFFRSRNIDPIVDSLDLGEVVTRYRNEFGIDEVDRWIQKLNSLKYLQDFSGGGFQHPDTFKTEGVSQRVPANPTLHVLQVMVNSLPASTPAWKKDLLKRFERQFRITGYYIHTKIMNEGWATLMQEIVAGHSKYVTDHHQIEFAKLLQGVAYPSLSNPYWLGREAWRRIRARFNERLLKTKGPVGPLERDRQFIEYAQTLIREMDDYRFLSMAFDEEWVRKYNLQIQAPLPWNQWDWEKEGRSQEKPWQWMVVSDSPGKVIKQIASDHGDKSKLLPQVKVLNASAYGRGVFALQYDVRDKMPIQMRSAALTMYVMAQILNRPVSIDTEFPVYQTVFSEYPGRPGIHPLRMHPSMMGGWFEEAALKLRRYRLEVSASGEVKFYDFLDDGTEYVHPLVTPHLQGEVNDYKLSLYGTDSRENLELEEIRRYGAMASSAMDRGLSKANRLASAAPTASTALAEYHDFVMRRMPELMKQLASGTLPWTPTKAGAVISVLPEIPSFTFDRKANRQLTGSDRQNPVEPDYLPMVRSGSWHVGSSERMAAAAGKRVGSGRGRPGDKYWGQNPDGNGKGEGEDEGEPGDEEGDDPDVSVGGDDPGVVTLPWDVVLDMFDGDLEIPNLRPKKAGAEDDNFVREASRRGGGGQIRWEKTAVRAMELGRAEFQRRGKVGTPQLWLKAGLKLLTAGDYSYWDKDPEPKPKTKVVVIVSRDMSGSMTNEPNARIRELLHLMTVLLRRRYDEIEFRYLGATTVSREFTEREYWQTFAGGGNDYSVQLKHALQVAEEYSDDEYDRVLAFGGDFVDTEYDGFMSQLKQKGELFQYAAFLHVEMYPDPTYAAKFENTLTGMSRSMSNIGYVKFGVERGNPVQTLKRLLTPGGNPESP